MTLWDCVSCDKRGLLTEGVLHTLTVHSPAGTPGADGHVDLTDPDNWAPEGTIRATFLERRNTLQGREFVSADQVHGEVTHRLETRSTTFSRSIRSDWELRFEGRRLQVVAARDVGERREIVRIDAKEEP